LKGSRKKKEEKECIFFFILLKLKGPFHVFASTSFSTMDALENKFAMPILEEFCECLTREEEKISTLEMTSSSSKVLSASSSKGKVKAKPKPHTTPSQQTPPKQSKPKRNDSYKKNKPKSNVTCDFFGTLEHPSNSCSKKMHALEEAMKKYKIVIPKEAPKNAPKEQGRALNI